MKTVFILYIILYIFVINSNKISHIPYKILKQSQIIPSLIRSQIKIPLIQNQIKYYNIHRNPYYTQNQIKVNHKSDAQKQLQTVILFGIICLLVISLGIILAVIYFVIQDDSLKQCFQSIYPQKKIQFKYVAQRDWCAICLNDRCNLILQCNHYFHRQCFEEWIQRKKCCPVCKSGQISYTKIITCLECRKYCMMIRKQKLMKFRITEKCCNKQTNQKVN